MYKSKKLNDFKVVSIEKPTINRKDKILLMTIFFINLKMYQLLN